MGLSYWRRKPHHLPSLPLTIAFKNHWTVWERRPPAGTVLAIRLHRPAYWTSRERWLTNTSAFLARNKPQLINWYVGITERYHIVSSAQSSPPSRSPDFKEKWFKILADTTPLQGLHTATTWETLKSTDDQGPPAAVLISCPGVPPGHWNFWELSWWL